MVDDGVLEVRVIEGEHAEGLQRLEQLAVRLTEVERQIEDCKGKLSQVEGELEEFRQRSELERRFSELTGLSYHDKSLELEEEMKSLKSRLESLTSERAELYKEILKGLSNVIFPLEEEASAQVSEVEVFFKFRDGGKYPAITRFLKSELKFGVPPVYVTVLPEGVKVVGASDKTSALKELINAIEALRAKAASECERHKAESLSLKHSLEGFPLFKKFVR